MPKPCHHVLGSNTGVLCGGGGFGPPVAECKKCQTRLDRLMNAAAGLVIATEERPEGLSEDSIGKARKELKQQLEKCGMKVDCE